MPVSSPHAHSGDNNAASLTAGTINQHHHLNTKVGRVGSGDFHATIAAALDDSGNLYVPHSVCRL